MDVPSSSYQSSVSAREGAPLKPCEDSNGPDMSIGGVIGGLFGELSVVGGLGLYPISLIIDRGKKI